MRIPAIAILLLVAPLLRAGEQPCSNLLRNGSFEDSHKYWYWGLDQTNVRVVEGGVAGGHALRIDMDF